MMVASMRGSILPPHKTSPTFRPGEALRLGQHGGEARGARTLRHRLLQREIRVDRALDVLLIHQENVAHQRADDRQRQRPTFFTAMPSASVAPPSGRFSPWIAFHIDG